MTALIACNLEIGGLAEAAAVRGLGLVPFVPGVPAEAALFRGSAETVARVRARLVETVAAAGACRQHGAGT